MAAFLLQERLEIGRDVDSVESAGAELFGVVWRQEHQPCHGRDVDLAAEEIPDQLLQLHHVPAVLRHQIVRPVGELAEHLERLGVGGFRRVLVGIDGRSDGNRGKSCLADRSEHVDAFQKHAFAGLCSRFPVHRCPGHGAEVLESLGVCVADHFQDVADRVVAPVQIEHMTVARVFAQFRGELHHVERTARGRFVDERDGRLRTFLRMDQILEIGGAAHCVGERRVGGRDGEFGDELEFAEIESLLEAVFIGSVEIHFELDGFPGHGCVFPSPKNSLTLVMNSAGSSSMRNRPARGSITTFADGKYSVHFRRARFV